MNVEPSKIICTFPSPQNSKHPLIHEQLLYHEFGMCIISLTIYKFYIIVKFTYYERNDKYIECTKSTFHLMKLCPNYVQEYHMMKRGLNSDKARKFFLEDQIKYSD